MKIGIFGGTFDPPHKGHIAIAEAALKSLELDEIIFVPAQRNPLKSKSAGASARDRLEMTRLAIQDHPQFALSDQEIVRGGQSFTIDTLDELNAIQPAQYWLVLGLDAVLQFPQWKSYQRILKMARLAVFNRSKDPVDVAIARVPQEVTPFVDFIAASSIDISSTDIRDRFEQGKPVSHLIAPAVEKYIRAKGLYK